MAADIEPKCSKIHGSRDPFKAPPNEESFVRREVLSKIVERSFQLWRPVGEQDHLCFFWESNEVSRIRYSPRHRIDSIAGGRQRRSTGSANELQKSSPVHEITSFPAIFMGFRPLMDFTDRVSKGMSPRKLFADEGFEFPVVDDGETDGTNLPKLAVGPHDALRKITTGTFHQRSCGWTRPRYFSSVGAPLAESTR